MSGSAMPRGIDLVDILSETSMPYLHEMQLRGDGVYEVEEKSDATLLTIADKESQRLIRECLVYPDLAFWGEEGETKGFIGDGRYGAIVDPLDGTNAFVVGLVTSTVILSIYDREERRTIACAIGEPVTGRIWVATAEEPTRLYLNGRYIGDCNARKCNVKNSTVFVDVAHGFKSHGRQVLTDKGNIALHAELCAVGAKMLIPGSNGLMQALVANGCERVYGSVTTAIGFPGDVCGGLLVQRAGGYTIGVKTRDDGGWEECDAGDPIELDALICSGTEEGARILLKAFANARANN